MLKFEIFISGKTEKNLALIASVTEVLTDIFKDRYDLEIFNVVDDHIEAINRGVVVTPTLIKVFPEPEFRVMGALNNLEELKKLLGDPMECVE
jgi:circadian clock protein KaiB